MHLLVLLHPCPVFCCCCCSVLYLLCISLSEGQLGRHMEHDLLLSMQGVDRLGTSLTMWHIQTSSKTARGRREQSKLANPPGLKILKHRRPFFDRNIDNREWMCIFLLVGTTRGHFSHPLKSCSSTVSPNSCRKSWKPGVSSLLLNSSSSDTWWTGERWFSHCNLASHYNRTPLALQWWKDFLTEPECVQTKLQQQKQPQEKKIIQHLITL